LNMVATIKTKVIGEFRFDEVYDINNFMIMPGCGNSFITSSCIPMSAR